MGVSVYPVRNGVSTSGGVTTNHLTVWADGTGEVLKDGGVAPILPGTSTTLGYLGIPQNSQSGNYVTVSLDAGYHIYHPVGDANDRTWTIAANGSVAYAIGTAITFVNMSPNDISLEIATDVLNYVNVGVVTTITIPQYNEVTAIKILSTAWLASGSAGVSTA